MKTYLIIGASSDIALSYIKHLEELKEKCLVICQYNRHDEELKKIKMENQYAIIDEVKCDLTSDDELSEMINYVREKEYSVDHILHAPVGRFVSSDIKKVTWEDIQREMKIEVYSFLEIMRAFLPGMAKKRYGKVVVMLSSCTIGVPPSTFSEYTTVKYALLGMMRSFASEYIKKNIQINGISPSMVETKLLDGVHNMFVDANAKESPLNRNLLPEDVVSSIDFLMSDTNVCLNGINLNLSSGKYM